MVYKDIIHDIKNGEKTVVSLITARGGSKGIPKKNIQYVNGKPLIWYTINSSKNSIVNDTWVSTDDEEIAEISEKCGAKILWRPKELADDIIMPDASLVHFAENVDFDGLVFIQPTSPLLEAKYIDKGIEMMNEYDSVFSAYKEHWLPRWNKNGIPIDWNVDERPRRQDMEETFVENGALYITTKKNLLDSGLRYSGNIGIIEMPMLKSFQVDSKHDLEIMEKLL